MSPSEIKARRRSLLKQVREAAAWPDTQKALSEVRRLRRELSRLDSETVTVESPRAAERVLNQVSDRTGWARLTGMLRSGRPVDYRRPDRGPEDVSDLIRDAARPPGWGQRRHENPALRRIG